MVACSQLEKNCAVNLLKDFLFLIPPLKAPFKITANRIVASAVGKRMTDYTNTKTTKAQMQRHEP